MRIRTYFSKTEALRYIGHLDLFRAWERTFRRSGLPLAYSQGFHPGPRLNLACALPLGVTSDGEILDAWLEMDWPLTDIRNAMGAALPPGLTIQSINEVDAKLPSLQTQVVSAVYVITFLDEIQDLAGRAERILSAKELIRRRRDRLYDLRPLLEGVTIIQPDELGKSRIRTQLAAREDATGRPDELLDELGIKFEDTRVHREKLVLRAD